MKCYIREILLCHFQRVGTFSQKHVATTFVNRQTLVLTFFEIGKLLLIVRREPARLVQLNRLVATFCVIFVFQTIFNHFKLQRTDRSNNFSVIELIYKKLRNAFVHQLVDSLSQLLEFHWIGIFNVAEHLGRETRNACKMQIFALGERVADFEVSRIVQTNNVARIRLVNHRFFLRHERSWVCKLQLLLLTDV